MDRLIHRAARLKAYARRLKAVAARELDACDAAGLRQLDDELRRTLEAVDDMRCEIAAALEEGTQIDGNGRAYLDAMISFFTGKVR